MNFERKKNDFIQTNIVLIKFLTDRCTDRLTKRPWKSARMSGSLNVRSLINSLLKQLELVNVLPCHVFHNLIN